MAYLTATFKGLHIQIQWLYTVGFIALFGIDIGSWAGIITNTQASVAAFQIGFQAFTMPIKRLFIGYWVVYFRNISGLIMH